MSYWAYGPGFHLGAGRKTNERRDRDGNRNRRAEAEPARARAVGFARKGRRPCPAVDRTEVEPRRARRRIYRRQARKSVVSGTSVSVRVTLGSGRILKNKQTINKT